MDDGSEVEGSKESFVRHVALYVPTHHAIACVGGGFTCFSFGTHTSRSALFRLPEWSAPRLPLISTANLTTSQCVTVSGGFTWRALPGVAASPTSWSQRGRSPKVFRNTDLGSCTVRWRDHQYLAARAAEVRVNIHVAQTAALDFLDKNYAVRNVSFPELVKHCLEMPSDAATAPQLAEVWYFRSVGRTSKSTDAAVHQQLRHGELLDFTFPALAADFSLPSWMQSEIQPRLHQSVLRVNQAGMKLWTHYDVMDNVLCQVVGRKRVVLFPPTEHCNLYLQGSSSPVVDIDQPDLAKWPRFAAARLAAQEVILEPGDVLFIPNLWPHSVHALDGCVSVNCFYERLAANEYDQHDAYGNKDLPVQKTAVNAAFDAAMAALEQIEDSEFRGFALQQLISKLSGV